MERILKAFNRAQAINAQEQTVIYADNSKEAVQSRQTLQKKHPVAVNYAQSAEVHNRDDLVSEWQCNLKHQYIKKTAVQLQSVLVDGGKAQGQGQESESVIEPNQQTLEALAAAHQSDAVYCLCQRVHNEVQCESMVGCDHCEQWFHIDCVGLTLKKFKALEKDENSKFYCEFCKSFKKIHEILARPMKTKRTHKGTV